MPYVLNGILNFVDEPAGQKAAQGQPAHKRGEHGGDGKDRVADYQGQHLYPQNFVDQPAGARDKQKQQDQGVGPRRPLPGCLVFDRLFGLFSHLNTLMEAIDRDYRRRRLLR